MLRCLLFQKLLHPIYGVKHIIIQEKPHLFAGIMQYLLLRFIGAFAVQLFNTERLVCRYLYFMLQHKE